MQNGDVAKGAMIRSRCDICGSGEYGEICRVEISPTSVGSKLVRCRDCGFFYANPPPARESEENYYKTRYHEDQSDGYWYEGRIDVFKRSLGRMGKFLKDSGALVDVGCGMGYFMDMAGSRGWETAGVDISDSGIRHAKDTLNLNVVRGSLRDAGFKENYFDAATLWNTLDQIYDPKDTLIEINRVLKKGGFVFIRVPNLSFHLKLFRFSKAVKYILNLKREDTITVFHLYSFDQRSIRNILKAAGFCNVRVRTEPIGVNVPDFVNVFGPRKEKIMRIFLDACANILYYTTLGRAILSPSLFVVAQKEKGL